MYGSPVSMIVDEDSFLCEKTRPQDDVPWEPLRGHPMYKPAATKRDPVTIAAVVVVEEDAMIYRIEKSIYCEK